MTESPARDVILICFNGVDKKAKSKLFLSSVVEQAIVEAGGQVSIALRKREGYTKWAKIHFRRFVEQNCRPDSKLFCAGFGVGGRDVVTLLRHYALVYGYNFPKSVFLGVDMQKGAYNQNHVYVPTPAMDWGVSIYQDGEMGGASLSTGQFRKEGVNVRLSGCPKSQIVEHPTVRQSALHLARLLLGLTDRTLKDLSFCATR